MNRRMDKKGGEKLLSLWWFFMLALIGGFIVLGVVLYYSADTNTNPLEAQILVNKLAECLMRNGKLIDNFNEINITKECRLDGKMFGVGSSLYFNVSINGLDIKKEFIEGIGSFEKDCDIGKKISGRYFPSCVKQTFFTTYNDRDVIINILGGSNQIGYKIPLN